MTGKKNSQVLRLVRSNPRYGDKTCCRMLHKRRLVCTWTVRSRTLPGRFLPRSCSRTRLSASSCLESSSTTRRPHRRRSFGHLCKRIVALMTPSMILTSILFALKTAQARSCEIILFCVHNRHLRRIVTIRFSRLRLRCMFLSRISWINMNHSEH